MGLLPNSFPDPESERFSPRPCFRLERGVHVLLAGLASVPILISVGIVGVFAYEASLFFQQVSFIDLWLDTEWTPLFSIRQFGVSVLLSGTFLIATIAMMLAIPLGILIAIYFADYAHPNTRRILKPAIEALNGIPTIVYGYFALLVVTPFLKTIFPSISPFNALSAGLLTGFLITPIISSISEDAIAHVPQALREGGYAIGFTQREVMWRIVLPNAFPGIMAGITLAGSRALGETMIAAIAAGQTPNLTFNPLQSVESITAFIVQVSLGDVPSDSFVFHTIFTVGCILFLITFGLNGLGHWLVYRHQRQMLKLVVPVAELRSLGSTSSNPTTDHLELLPPSDLLPQPEFTPSLSQRNRLDRVFQCMTGLATWGGIALLGWLLISTLQQGLPQLDWQFLSQLSSRNPEKAGIYAALLGTLYLLGLTALFAFPIGIGAAIYLEEYLPKNSWSQLLEIHLANLAAVPSILYGLLGLAVFARAWRGLTGGSSLLAAALVLTVIVLPLLIISTRTALRDIPEAEREAGYAVGMTRYQLLGYVLLPIAFPRIVTGLLLAWSRAIGEAAALIAVGAVAFVPFAPEWSLEGLRSQFITLPTQIFYWVSRPQPEFQQLTAAAVLVLGAMVLIMNVTAVLIRDRSHRL